MSGPAASEAERDNLVRHIKAFVEILERNSRQPTRREAYHCLLALEYLEVGDYERAEQAMRNAEHLVPLPASVAALRGIHEEMTTQQLYDRLAGLIDRSPTT